MDAASVLLLALASVLLGVCLVRGRRRSEDPTGSADPLADAASEALVVQRDRLSAALDALSVGVIVSDPTDRRLFTNRVAADILSSHDRRSLVADTVEQVTAAAHRGQSERREIDIFGPPSASYAVSAGALGESGEVVAFIENVTERHRVAQVRRDFVANISHELKTPVGAVGLLADTLQDETDPEVVERLSGRLAREVVRLSATIDDLLELSRIEFGEDAEVDDVTITSIVEEAVGRLRTAAEALGVSLEVELAAVRDVRGDRRQLVSAVSNLVDNAVKYSNEGGAVQIRSLDTDGDTVRIEVEDHGRGIPARDIDRIFERFFRVDRGRGRGTGGTGLGLAIVRHVAQNHGGVASVTSREGRGSTFTLTLPAADR